MTKEIALTPENVMQSIKGKITEDEYRVLTAIQTKNVIALGTDEAFALRDNEGEIKAFKQRIRLSAKEGTLIQPVPGGPYVISAQGYEVLAEGTGACVIFPKNVKVHGREELNPFVERDPDNKRVLAVHARAIAFRFSSKGIPQVSDWSTVFDTPAYRMIDLLAKAKKFPQAFRLLPEGIEPEDAGTWAKYDFDEATKLYVNTSHDEALQWFSQIINREKKCIDFAQTFAKRNALKHLTGLQKAPGPEWDVTVLCWRPTAGNIVKWDATQYAQLQDRVNAMIESPADQFKGKPAPQITNGREMVSDEQGFDEIEKTVDPEDIQDPIDITPDEPYKPPQSDTEAKEKSPPADPSLIMPEDPTDEQKSVERNYIKARQDFNEEFRSACSKLKISPNRQHDLEQASAIMKQMTQDMDV